MKEISVEDLHQKILQNKKFQLIDIREEWEVERASIGGEHIPMGELCSKIDKVKTDIPVIIHCKSGTRSSKMVRYLEENYDFQNLYSLLGGIEEWAKKIDNKIQID